MSSWGRLFPNNRKRPGNDAPDLTGDITVDGVSRTIVAWWRVGKRTGAQYLNVEVKDPKEPNVRKAGPGVRADGRVRTGRNAPGPEEVARVASLDKTLEELRDHGITAQNIADTFGGHGGPHLPPEKRPAALQLLKAVDG